MSYNLMFKVILFAMEDVGKKTLAKNLADNVFNEDDFLRSMKTLGIGFLIKHIELYGKGIRISLWIPSTEEHWRPLFRIHVHRSNGVILMYDITNVETLNNLSELWQMIKNDYAEDTSILLVGNKMDLEENREVSLEHLEKFKENHDISSLMEISLKTGENVEKMFNKLTRMMLRKTKIDFRIGEELYKPRLLPEYKKLRKEIKLKPKLTQKLKDIMKFSKTSDIHIPLFYSNLQDFIPEDEIIIYSTFYKLIMKSTFKSNYPLFFIPKAWITHVLLTSKGIYFGEYQRRNPPVVRYIDWRQIQKIKGSKIKIEEGYQFKPIREPNFESIKSFRKRKREFSSKIKPIVEKRKTREKLFGRSPISIYSTYLNSHHYKDIRKNEMTNQLKMVNLVITLVIFFLVCFVELYIARLYPYPLSSYDPVVALLILIMMYFFMVMIPLIFPICIRLKRKRRNFKI